MAAIPVPESAQQIHALTGPVVVPWVDAIKAKLHAVLRRGTWWKSAQRGVEQQDRCTHAEAWNIVQLASRDVSWSPLRNPCPAPPFINPHNVMYKYGPLINDHERMYQKWEFLHKLYLGARTNGLMFGLNVPVGFAFRALVLEGKIEVVSAQIDAKEVPMTIPVRTDKRAFYTAEEWGQLCEFVRLQGGEKWEIDAGELLCMW